MASADGIVVPKPGIPKTLGILNVIFGVLLVLAGLCVTGMSFAAPALLQWSQNFAKQAQAKVEAKEKADLKAIDDRIAAAKSEEEKKQIEQERAAVTANQVKITPMDISAATEALKNPTIMGVSYAGMLSGLVLHVLLLISGIGLIRLTPWGRSLALWWAGLMIVQVMALLAATIIIVMPVNKPITDKAIAKAQEAAKAPGAGPNEAFALQMVQLGASMAVPSAVGQSLSGIIYPIVLLIMLNQAAAKAACRPKKLEGFADL